MARENAVPVLVFMLKACAVVTAPGELDKVYLERAAQTRHVNVA